MDIKLSQILFQMINFGVVFGGLTYLLYKPVSKLLEERAEKATQSEKRVEDTLREKQEIEEMKQKAKVLAEKNAVSIIETAKKEAAEYKKKSAKELKDETSREKAKLLKTWEIEKKAFVEEAKKQFSSAVFSVVEKVLGNISDRQIHTKLIDLGIKELSESMS